MACQAGQNDRLAVNASTLKREESKPAKCSGSCAGKEADSDSDSDESMHNLEVPIPRKKVQRLLNSTSLTPRGSLKDYKEQIPAKKIK